MFRRCQSVLTPTSREMKLVFETLSCHIHSNTDFADNALHQELGNDDIYTRLLCATNNAKEVKSPALSSGRHLAFNIMWSQKCPCLSLMLFSRPFSK